MGECCKKCPESVDSTLDVRRAPYPGAYDAVLLRRGGLIYSPWFAREGDYLIATLDLIQVASAKIDVVLRTKNNDERGNGVIVDEDTSITLTSPGRAYNEWNPQTGIGLRELVRYRFSCTLQNPVTQNPMVLFRMLSPVWFDAVRGPA